MNLNEQQKVILYLIKNIKSFNIKRTLIFKLLFLADWEFHSIYNERITSYEYCKYDYGPFCTKIYDDLEELESKDIIKSKKNPVIDYVECKYELKMKDIKLDIHPIKKKLLDNMVKIGNKLSLSEVLNLVYSIPEVKETPLKARIIFPEEKLEYNKNDKKIKKYKEIIKKLGLFENEVIPEEYSNDIVKDFLKLKRSIDIANKEFLTE